MSAVTEPHGDVVGADLEQYRLLVAVVAGRELRIERGAQGDATHTDGQRIVLARRESDDPVADLNEAVVQASLLAAGSLDLHVAKRLLGRPSLARRYLGVEGWRALKEIGERFPGVPIVTSSNYGHPTTESVEDSLAVAASRRVLPDVPSCFGVVRPRRLLMNAVVLTAPTEQNLATGSNTIHAPDEADEDDETDSLGWLAKLLRNPLESPLSRWFASQKGAGREQSGESATDDVALGGARSVVEVGPNARAAQMPEFLEPVQLPNERGYGWRYPEWDVDHQRYRPRWCTVVERDPILGPANLAPALAFSLRRDVARLGRMRERHRRQPCGEEFDLDAVVRASISRIGGSHDHDAVYIDRRLTRPGLSVMILLDISGSCGEQSANRAVYEHQRDAALDLLTALDDLGNRVALYGFWSRGRGAVHLLRVKTFDDRLSQRVRRRLAGLEPGGFTRMGAAIRHASHLLTTSGGTGKMLMLVLSDGFAFDDAYEAHYAEADTSRALEEARRSGIGCLCLALGTSTASDALVRVFGTASFATARDWGGLAKSIGVLAPEALASADLKRRLAKVQ